jgi:hypothetical protein
VTEEDEARRDELAMALAEAILPACREAVRSTGEAASVVMGLAYVAGEVIAAASADPEHLEEGLLIFADLTADQARGRYEAEAARSRPN